MTNTCPCSSYKSTKYRIVLSAVETTKGGYFTELECYVTILQSIEQNLSTTSRKPPRPWHFLIFPQFCWNLFGYFFFILSWFPAGRWGLRMFFLLLMNLLQPLHELKSVVAGSISGEIQQWRLITFLWWHRTHTGPPSHSWMSSAYRKVLLVYPQGLSLSLICSISL